MTDVQREQVGYYLEQKYGLDTAYVPEASTWVLLVTGLFGPGPGSVAPAETLIVGRGDR